MILLAPHRDLRRQPARRPDPLLVVDRNQRVPQRTRRSPTPRSSTRSDETFVNADSNFHDMFCAGITTLEDGTILASGGNPSDRRTSSFDPDDAHLVAESRDDRSPLVRDERDDAGQPRLRQLRQGRGEPLRALRPGRPTPGRRRPTPTCRPWSNEQNAIQSAPNPTGALNHEWWSHLTVAPQGDLIDAPGPTQTWHRFDPIGGARQRGARPADRRHALACTGTRSTTTRGR